MSVSHSLVICAFLEKMKSHHLEVAADLAACDVLVVAVDLTACESMCNWRIFFLSSCTQ